MPDFFMTPEETRILAWIHSNKFITTKLFHQKFLPEKTFQTACNWLEKLSQEKGFLKQDKAHKSADSFYFCTRGTIHQLKDLGLVLTSREIRAPHQNTYEKKHDKIVTQFRIQYEKDPSFKNLVWVSDYEMRIGYNMGLKKTLLKGNAADLRNLTLYKESSRVPDAHFEAVVKGKLWEFILEYEDSSYGREKLNGVVDRILEGFSKPIKLIVTKEPGRARFLMERIGKKIHDPQERAAWWFSDYKAVSSLPFLNVPWVDLDDYHPALIDPKGKKKSYPVDNKPPNQENLDL